MTRLANSRSNHQSIFHLHSSPAVFIIATAPTMLMWLVTSLLATMTSILSSLFTSANTALTSRVQALRDAENSLIDLARHQRFLGGGPDMEQEIVAFDTEIPRSVLPLASKQGGVCGGGKGNGGKCQINTVDDNEEHYIVHGVKVDNTVSSPSTTVLKSPLVILHGYMNGSLYFYRNLSGLARYFSSVYSLDQLGWGLSSRPSFEHHVPNGVGCDDANEKNNNEFCPVETSEAFFVESLEAWRRANNIDRMNLLGHSMGGYLSVAYAERYPQHVDRLILLSPVGVPRHDPEEDPLSRPDISLRYKMLFGTFRFLWSRGTTPGSFARSIPQSQARNMIDKYVEGEWF